MRAQTVSASQGRRVVAGLPFVESLARRMASTMPNSIDIGDLVQDGVLGLIDAANRFDEGRGIKFETFAERRVRCAKMPGRVGCAASGASWMPRAKRCAVNWAMSRRWPTSPPASAPTRNV